MEKGKIKQDERWFKIGSQAALIFTADLLPQIPPFLMIGYDSSVSTDILKNVHSVVLGHKASLEQLESKNLKNFTGAIVSISDDIHHERITPFAEWQKKIPLEIETGPNGSVSRIKFEKTQLYSSYAGEIKLINQAEKRYQELASSLRSKGVLNYKALPRETGIFWMYGITILFNRGTVLVCNPDGYFLDALPFSGIQPASISTFLFTDPQTIPSPEFFKTWERMNNQTQCLISENVPLQNTGMLKSKKIRLGATQKVGLSISFELSETAVKTKLRALSTNFDLNLQLKGTDVGNTLSFHSETGLLTIPGKAATPVPEGMRVVFKDGLPDAEKAAADYGKTFLSRLKGFQSVKERDSVKAVRGVLTVLTGKRINTKQLEAKVKDLGKSLNHLQKKSGNPFLSPVLLLAFNIHEILKQPETLVKPLKNIAKLEKPLNAQLQENRWFSGMAEMHVFTENDKDSQILYAPAQDHMDQKTLTDIHYYCARKDGKDMDLTKRFFNEEMLRFLGVLSFLKGPEKTTANRLSYVKQGKVRSPGSASEKTVKNKKSPRKSAVKSLSKTPAESVKKKKKEDEEKPVIMGRGKEPKKNRILLLLIPILALLGLGGFFLIRSCDSGSGVDNGNGTSGGTDDGSSGNNGNGSTDGSEDDSSATDSSQDSTSGNDSTTDDDTGGSNTDGGSENGSDSGINSGGDESGSTTNNADSGVYVADGDLITTADLTDQEKENLLIAVSTVGDVRITVLDIINTTNYIATQNGYNNLRRDLSNVDDPALIYKGLEFQMPGGDYYIVEYGDSIWDISQEYLQVSVTEDLRKLTAVLNGSGSREEKIQDLQNLKQGSLCEDFRNKVQSKINGL